MLPECLLRWGVQREHTEGCNILLEQQSRGISISLPAEPSELPAIESFSDSLSSDMPHRGATCSLGYFAGQR
jgi:hypothetical protein